MKRLLPISFFLTLILGFATNAYAAPNFCTEKSWYDRGLEVGARGGSARLLNKYMDKCKDAKTRENLRDYQRGFITGMKQYCTFENGRELAKMNKPMNELCPNEFSEDFIAGYKAGRIEKREMQKFLDDAGDDRMLPTENNPNKQQEVGQPLNTGGL